MVSEIASLIDGELDEIAENVKTVIECENKEATIKDIPVKEEKLRSFEFVTPDAKALRTTTLKLQAGGCPKWDDVKYRHISASPESKQMVIENRESPRDPNPS